MSNVKELKVEIFKDALLNELRGLLERIDETHTDLCDASNERYDIGIAKNCTKNRQLIRQALKLVNPPP